MKILTITPEDLGNINQIYTKYYESVILQLPKKDQLISRKLIEEGLIFEDDKRRLSLYQGQILKQFNVGAELLRKLTDSFIIRPENTSGGTFYEISHDTLVEPILKVANIRKQTEQAKEILRIQKQKEEEERIKKERIRKQKALIRISFWSLTLSIVFFLLTLFAITMWQKSERQKEEIMAAYIELSDVIEIRKSEKGGLLSMKEQIAKLQISAINMNTIFLRVKTNQNTIDSLYKIQNTKNSMLTSIINEQQAEIDSLNKNELIAHQITNKPAVTRAAVRASLLLMKEFKSDFLGKSLKVLQEEIPLYFKEFVEWERRTMIKLAKNIRYLAKNAAKLF